MLKKLIGLGFVFGVAATVSVFAGGCSSTTITDPPDSGKLTEGGAHPDGGNGGTDSGPTVGNCPVPITAMDIAEVNPPKDNTTGSCTDTELTKITGKFADIFAAVSSTCAGCLFSEAADMTNSQFFIWSDTMHANVSLENFGACMGSTLSGGNAKCGKSAEELESCLESACPRDPTSGATTCTDITDQECVTAAIAGDCKQYNDKQTTDCGGATPLKAIFGKCFDAKGSPDPGIKLLCGGAAAADAGPG